MWGFCQPKTAPTRLGEVSYHWAVGEQQGGYRNRLRRVFQPLTSRCDSRLRSSGQRDRNTRARGRFQRVVMPCVRRSWRSSRAASYNLCPVRPVWATTGNQGCHSYSPVAHRLRNTRPEKAGSFLSVILRQTIIGRHGNRCQLHPKLASLCRFRATLNRYRSG
jgi:hypothetical protein